MSRATELADELDSMSERITRYTNSPGDGLCAEAAETIRRLDRVKAELVEALNKTHQYLTSDAPRSVSTDAHAAFEVRTALTSSTGDTQ